MEGGGKRGGGQHLNQPLKVIKQVAMKDAFPCIQAVNTVVPLPTETEGVSCYHNR